MQKKVIILPEREGYTVVGDGGETIAGPFVTVGEAVEAAEGMEIINMDAVEGWQRPPDDWGLRA